nr:MAG TPA: hypothetical protein [Caudoviricetes sp.]
MQYGNIIPTVYPTGVFIQSIEQTQTSTEAGGKNIITVTLTNHTQQRFEILNGAKGGTGDAASIKEITASIDNGIGTPSVTVTATGTGAEKNVHFDFKNLKGETGDVALTEEVKQHISRSVASANQYTDDAIGAIEQRIDTGDTNTLQAAEKYADQTVQAEAQTREQCDADTLSSAKKYTDELLIKIFQNGYIQWPWMPKPETVFTFEGYRWAEVNYDGCFFRSKGKGANPFDGEEQGDAIRDVVGEIRQWGNRGGFHSVTGAFKSLERHPFLTSADYYDNDYSAISKCEFKASNANVPTAEENRSRNRTFIIWKLEKI